MELVEYNSVRSHLRAGDVIAFGGKGFFSSVIKVATNHPCSHVGIVFTTVPSPKSGEQLNLIIESTSLDGGKAGVQVSRLSERITNYNGNVWWLPLSDNTRAKLDEDKFFDFLIKQKGKAYDLPQAIGSAEDLVICNKEDFSKLFCSELVIAALEKGGVLEDVNASEYTPGDVCMENLYAFYSQFTGKITSLPDFNKGGVVA